MAGIVTAQFLAGQLARFGKLPKYPGGDSPEDKAARADTIAALRQVCPDEDRAVRVVELLLRNARFFPSVAEIYEAGRVVREAEMPEWQPNPISDCPDCGGSGWRSVNGADGYARAERFKVRAADRILQDGQRIRELEKQIAELRASSAEQVERYEEAARAALALADEMERKIAEADPLPEAISVAALRAELDRAKQANALIAKRDQRNQILREAAALDKEADELTKRMDKRQADKIAAISSAKMPVLGLSFDSGRVLLNGLPFDQASGAEQLRTSVAIAMAANSKLRVIRIKDGSLLDEDGMQIIAEMAAGRDYQVWVERVDSTGKIGIVMEDGEVAGDNQLTRQQELHQ